MNFSDYYNIKPEIIEKYGAFNISLISDIPLFIDPFQLFSSDKPKYKKLHDEIIKYLKFLRKISVKNSQLTKSQLDSWFLFNEVKNTWLGFSFFGNAGLGLGNDFAKKLNKNLHDIFSNFGEEIITESSHLEKLCLIEERIGKDKISDFTTNLIKEFLLEYTESFTKKFIDKKYRKKFIVEKVSFNYKLKVFNSKEYELPKLDKSYVLLTPKDILTKDETWINKKDLIDNFEYYTQPDSMPNNVLRDRLNSYLVSKLKGGLTKKEREKAIFRAIAENPQTIDYFINYKEENKDKAFKKSKENVKFSDDLYVKNFGEIRKLLYSKTDFYKLEGDSYTASLSRAKFYKDIIENKGGYKYLQPTKNEADLKLLYRTTWYKTIYDVSSEVNDGGGAADFKISRGPQDKTIIEFKLASNTQLKTSLKNQTKVYKKASDANKDIYVIVYFTELEEKRVIRILNEIGIVNKENIVLVDARSDNKPTGSRA